MSFLGSLGLVFHYGELNLPLHVVNAVNDDANFVANGVGLLGSRSDDLARVFVI